MPIHTIDWHNLPISLQRHPKPDTTRRFVAFEAFEPAGFPEAHTRMVAFAGAEVDAVDVVLSSHIEPARQKPGAAALALGARQ